MRFAFAGIDFLADAFDGFVAGGWEPVALFTRPCDDVHDTNVRVVAEAHRRRLPISLSRIVPRDLATLAEIGCDALVVAGYPWRIPTWEGTVRHALNFHPSPLPEGRGPYPLYRAIQEARETWGMSAHVLDADFDTGPVLARETFPLSPQETHETLLVRCQIATNRIARALAADLSGAFARAVPQSGGSYFPRASDADRTLDFRLPVETLMRRVRAFGPIETLARIGQGTIHVAQAHAIAATHDHEPGRLVHQYRRTLTVAAGDGFLVITRWSPVSLDAARNFGR
ncbi:methionyl-tRNA formyltransferase [Salinarimonas sp. NSM]|uniref:methionyl-tRNA formyltransferase n=1 Tax=Salinarimonas sp. NSM TaxID=3458003 RepID=UPI004035A29E